MLVTECGCDRKESELCKGRNRSWHFGLRKCGPLCDAGTSHVSRPHAVPTRLPSGLTEHLKEEDCQTIESSKQRVNLKSILPTLNVTVASVETYVLAFYVIPKTRTAEISFKVFVLLVKCEIGESCVSLGHSVTGGRNSVASQLACVL